MICPEKYKCILINHSLPLGPPRPLLKLPFLCSGKRSNCHYPFFCVSWWNLSRSIYFHFSVGTCLTIALEKLCLFSLFINHFYSFLFLSEDEDVSFRIFR